MVKLQIRLVSLQYLILLKFEGVCAMISWMAPLFRNRNGAITRPGR